MLLAKVKQEKVQRAFRSLKTTPQTTIELDSPSPKNTRASPSSTLPPPKRVKGPLNPDLPGLVSGPDSGDEDVLPQIGHRPDELEAELERLMDEQDQEGDAMDADDCQVSLTMACCSAWTRPSSKRS